MIKNTALRHNIIRSNKASPWMIDMIKQQLILENPKLASNPNLLSKEVMERLNKSAPIDSSYYLG